MNIAKRSVTPDFASTYAEMSYAVLQEVGLETESLDADALRRRFPYLDADIGRLDVDAGVVNLPAVTDALTRVLGERGVQTVEGVETTAIERDGDALRVVTDAGEFVTRSLVVTAGHGTNALLARLPGCELQVPLTKDRPSEAKYFTPPADARERFTAGAMPVIAYLDAGIYCHPIVDGLAEAVKIGYYNPPDMPRGTTSIDSIASFIEQCMPGLADAEMRDVEDVDQCDYDLVADDDFVLGAVPGRRERVRRRRLAGHRLQVRAVGRAACSPASRSATAPNYDIDRFDPARFLEGGSRMDRPSQRTLQQRLADGVVVGAEGYVFELERRGYIKAGPFVPEVILDEPDALRQLHREFLRAGSDVMVALTYYAHRDKLKAVGRGDDLEELNRQAVRIANEIAAEGGALVAGNICNTWSYDPAEPERVGRGGPRAVRGAARLGGRGGRRLRDRGDQRLRRRGPDRARGVPGARPARRWSPSPACSRPRPTTATSTSRRAAGSPTPARRSSASTARAARRRCSRCSRRSARRSTSRSRPSRSPTGPPTRRRPSRRSRPTAATCSRSSSSPTCARASRWRTSPARPRPSASTTSASAAAARPTTSGRWPRRSAARRPPSRYSPDIALHPVLGIAGIESQVMGGWSAGAA